MAGSTRFNPNRPNIAGMEWYGSSVHAPPVTQNAAAGVTLQPATVTETIDAVDTVILASGGVTPPYVVCDVYPYASIVPTQTLALAKPATNVSAGADWQEWNSGTFTPYDVNAHNFVDDIVSLADPLTTGDTDALIYTGVNTNVQSSSEIMFYPSNAAFWDGTTGASGATVASKRCCQVEVVAICNNETASPIVVFGQLRVGAITIQSNLQIVQPNSSYVRVNFAFNLYPFSNPAQPWNQSQIASILSGGGAFGIAVGYKSAVGNFVVTALMLQMHVATESRLATGFATTSTTNDEWAGFTMLSPVDYSTASWSKVNGSSYAILFAPVNGTVIDIPFIDSAAVSGHGADGVTGTAVATVPLGPGLVPASALTAVVGQRPLLLGHLGAGSLDSNAYAWANVITGGAGHRQGISVGSAQAYGTVTIVVAATSNGMGGVLQDQPLTVYLKKTSDNSILLGPFTLSPGDIPADGLFHVVSFHGAPTTLTNLEPVYIEADSTAVNGWLLPVLSTITPGISSADSNATLANTVTAGGTSDVGDSTNWLDFPWNIVVSPSTPSGLAAAQASYTQPVSPPCGPTIIHYASITWTATSLGGAFGYYELQRLDGGVWGTIALVTTEANPHFYDNECVRNAVSSYRLRVLSNLGGLSDWTSTVTVTVTTSLNCDLILASNYVPTKALAFQEAGNSDPLHTFARANAGSTVVHLIAGRKTPVAFRPLIEGDSDVFQRTLIIAADNPGALVASASADRAAFDALISLIEDPTAPYVALMDGRGRRWFAFPEFVQGTYTWRGHVHTADIKFTEVATVPTALQTTTPVVP